MSRRWVAALGSKLAAGSGWDCSGHLRRQLEQPVPVQVFKAERLGATVTIVAVKRLQFTDAYQTQLFMREIHLHKVFLRGLPGCSTHQLPAFLRL